MRPARLARPALVLAALVAGASARATAQLSYTGASTATCPAGTCDTQWTVLAFGISGLTAGVAPTSGPAVVVDAPPSPPWAPNVPGVQQWISTRSSATQDVRTGDNAPNYRYFFQTTFATPEDGAQRVQFGLGWDNRLVGAYRGWVTVNPDGSYDAGSATSLIGDTGPGAPYAGGRSGFCRDADGVFPDSAHPDCLVDLSADLFAPGSEAMNLLTFVVEGDGTTDGLMVGAPSAAALATVPEPSTYALMGTGLAALVGVARRRRAAA